MKKLLCCGVLAAAALLPSTAARAYGDAPWCLKASVGLGTVTEICDFGTFEQCRDQRGFWGNAAFCVQNSRYLPYWNGRDATPKKPRKKKHRNP